VATLERKVMKGGDIGVGGGFERAKVKTASFIFLCSEGRGAGGFVPLGVNVCSCVPTTTMLWRLDLMWPSVFDAV
jgi:hypothetical protein